LYEEDGDDDDGSSIGEEPGDVEEEFVRLVLLPELIASSGLYVANRLWRFENIRCIVAPKCRRAKDPGRYYIFQNNIGGSDKRRYDTKGRAR
jgi:hypothetical protein